MPDMAVCTKCGAKWSTEMLERKGIKHCQLCKEPGLRVMDERGEASEETWPPEARG
jgi:hypothetical protein